MMGVIIMIAIIDCLLCPRKYIKCSTWVFAHICTRNDRKWMSWHDHSPHYFPSKIQYIAYYNVIGPCMSRSREVRKSQKSSLLKARAHSTAKYPTDHNLVFLVFIKSSFSAHSGADWLPLSHTPKHELSSPLGTLLMIQLLSILPPPLLLATQCCYFLLSFHFFLSFTSPLSLQKICELVRSSKGLFLTNPTHPHQFLEPSSQKLLWKLKLHVSKKAASTVPEWGNSRTIFNKAGGVDTLTETGQPLSHWTTCWLAQLVKGKAWRGTELDTTQAKPSQRYLHLQLSF